MITLVEREDDWLRAALAASDRCPSLEDLAAMPDGGAECCAHVTNCPRCLTELAMWKRFDARFGEAANAADVRWIARRLEARLRPPLRVQKAPENRGWRFRFAVPSFRTLAFTSASVFALVLAGALHLRRTTEPVLMARSGWSQPVILRSAGISVLGPTGEIETVPRELSWRAVPGADHYEVSLRELDGAEVWRAAVPQTSVVLPAPARDRIVPSKILLWRVVARDGAGRELSASQTVRFRLAPQSRN